jgi:hypothetical protein
MLMVFEALLALSVVLVAFGRWCMALSLRVARRRYSGRPIPTDSVTFSETGITHKSDASEATRTWADLKSVRFGERFVYLQFRDRTCLYVPLAAFPSADAVDGLVALAHARALHARLDLHDNVSAECAKFFRARGLPEENKLKNTVKALVIFFLLLGEGGILAAIDPRNTNNRLFLSWMLGYCLLGGFVGLVIYVGVRRMASWARIPLIVLSCAALAAIPIGTVLGICILAILFSDRVPPLLTRRYEEVVARAPVAHPRTSRLTWLVLLLIVLLLIPMATMIWHVRRLRPGRREVGVPSPATSRLDQR